MNQQKTYTNQALFLALVLALGCGESSGGVPTVDSDLMGVYQVTSYRGSLVDCEEPEDIEPSPAFLVLYSFIPNDQLDESRLGGVFCSTVEVCRQAARDAVEPTIGYSFLEGDDATGWQGWAISSAGASSDQCRADVQAHVLTSPTTGEIGIETQTFVTVFPPMYDGNEAICSNRDALASLEPDLPCSEILLLEGTLEAGL